MKMPRVFSNRIGKWSLLALLPLLAAGTFIVASEEPDAQQGLTVGAATRFVMFDETSKGESGRLHPQKIVVPNTVKVGEFTSSAIQFEVPAAYNEKSPDSGSVSPVIRPASAPTLLSTTEEVEQAAVATRFVASDHVEPFELQEAFRQATESLPLGQATSSATSGFAGPAPLFREPSEPVVREAYNPFDNQSLGALPVADERPRSFTFSGDDENCVMPMTGREAAPAVIAQGRFSMTVPDDHVAQLSAVEEDGILPALSADRMAQGFTMQDAGGVAALATARPDVARTSFNEASTGTQSASPSDFVPELEAAIDQYEFASEAPYFAEPAMSADCGMACPRTWYAEVDLMYVQRVSANHVSLTINDVGGLERFDFQSGARITLGRIRDCLDGVELVYTGIDDWTEGSLIRGDNLNANIDSDIFDLSAFENAQVQTQLHRSSFHNIELNRKWWGWDVISTSFGVRYIRVGEEYQFDSIKQLAVGPNELGTFNLDLKNNFIGPQVGLDLCQSLGRWTGSIESKAGVYLNYIDASAGLVNAGQRQFMIDDEKGQLGFEAEIGFHVKYQLAPRVNLLAGYEFWYLWGVATATKQDVSHLRQERHIYSKDDIFYQGGSLGVEMVW